jgi:hypothetical protein
MEGGSLEVNDAGAPHDAPVPLAPTRNRQDEASLERALAGYLGLLHIIWMDHGLEGDHTDGHIDTLTRFADDTTIVTSVCADTSDPNHATLAANLDVLRRARGADGAPFRIVVLPIPSGRVEFEGERLPLTYANFYVITNAVLVPVYGAHEDQQALDILTPLFPGRESSAFLRARAHHRRRRVPLRDAATAGRPPVEDRMSTALGVIQMRMTDTIGENVDRAIAHVREAAGRGARRSCCCQNSSRGSLAAGPARGVLRLARTRSTATRSSRSSSRSRRSWASSCRSPSSRKPATRTTTAW